jgi:4-oxalocrotonate tautomerase
VPSVTIQQGPRSAELKRDLVARITDAFVDVLKVPADTVEVWIQEIEPENRAVAGRLVSDAGR